MNLATFSPGQDTLPVGHYRSSSPENQPCVKAEKYDLCTK